MLDGGVGLALFRYGADAHFQESLAGSVLAQPFDRILRCIGRRPNPQLSAAAGETPGRPVRICAQNGTSEISLGIA